MSAAKPKRWIPYAIALVGVIASFTLWNHVKDYDTLLGLSSSLTISALLAIVVGVLQVARERDAALKQTNEDLKNEIAERILAEETKQKLEVALLQGQKLQAIGTLASGIAHDFNNLLYAIIGYTELAREDVPPDSKVSNNLGKILEAAHRGQDLISRIMSFSRRQHHRLEVIDLTTTIEAALSLLRPAIPSGVIIRFERPADVKIMGNQTQLHQILVNIITNAVDAMDGEGTITISLTKVPEVSPLLKEFPDTLTQNYCKIEITDSGHGMSKSVMERIFEPFFTTKEVGKGTGLGLSMVHSIVKDHRGEITVKSTLGQGTTFIILLPEYKGT